MLTLFHDSELFQKERPIKITEQQKTELINDSVEHIISKYIKNIDKEDIVEMLEYYYPFKTFNDIDDDYDYIEEEISNKFNIQINEELFGHLNYLSMKIDKSLVENVKQWVNAHSIKLKYNDYQYLKVLKPFGRFKVDDIIVVNGVYNETARYIVDKDYNIGLGTIIDGEVIENNCEPLEITMENNTKLFLEINTKKQIAIVIKDIMGIKNITKDDLKLALNIPIDRVELMLEGKYNFNVDYLVVIANRLDMSINELFLWN